MARTRGTDPFDRVIARESKLRRKGEMLTTRTGAIRLAAGMLAALAVGWGSLLALHWVLLDEPRWLVVLHTVVFALTVGYWLATAAFATYLLRRTPGLRDEL